MLQQLGSRRAAWAAHAGRCSQRPAAARSLRCSSSLLDGGIPWLASVQCNRDESSSSSSSSSTPLAQQQPFDAVFVLAGGLQPDGSCPEWVTRRCDVALGLHRLQQGKPPIVLLGGGTPHKPSIITPSGHTLHESTSCAQYLIEAGADPSKLYKETSSYDTVGNAYFSLTIHALPAGWRRVAVATSSFHMPRTRALFSDVWALAGESIYGDADRFDLTFLAASDEGIFTDHVYQARVDKEASSCADWKAVHSGLRDLPAFHRWFYQTHLCYAVPRQHEFGRRTIKDEALLNSY